MGLVLPDPRALISIDMYRDCASGDTILPRNGIEQIFYHDPVSGPYQVRCRRRPPPTSVIPLRWLMSGRTILPIPPRCSHRADHSASGSSPFDDVIVTGGSEHPVEVDKRIDLALADVWRITVEFFVQAQ